MKPETRLALLEAFAKSKGYEFRGFTLRWLQAHPEPEEPALPTVGVPEKAEPEPAYVLKDETGEVKAEFTQEEVIEEEKPKRKRKKAETEEVKEEG